MQVVDAIVYIAFSITGVGTQIYLYFEFSGDEYFGILTWMMIVAMCIYVEEDPQGTRCEMNGASSNTQVFIKTNIPQPQIKHRMHDWKHCSIVAVNEVCA